MRIKRERPFGQFQADPGHLGLRFKRVSRKNSVYSARIGLDYRALGLFEGDTVTWFWIGPHDAYERLLCS